MSASTITAFTPIAELSLATPGLFNSRFQVLQDNIVSVNSGVISPSVLSQTTYAAITLVASSNSSSYLRFIDSSAQRSSYRLGSFDGGTDDGLNLWDESGNTMLVSFSKQSIRFYQQVVGPVFDVGGALADTLNAATFGTGSDSKESRIQAALDAANATSISRVYIPASMLPYSASSVSFYYDVQVTREGGSDGVNDLRAYGADPLGVADATASFAAALRSGPVTYVPPGEYRTSSAVSVGLPLIGAKLYGDYSGCTIKPTSSVTRFAVQVGSNAFLAGLFIEGSSTTSCIGLDIGSDTLTNLVTIRDVQVSGFSAGNGIGVMLGQLVTGDLNNVHSSTNKYGLVANGGNTPTDTSLYNCQFRSNRSVGQWVVTAFSLNHYKCLWENNQREGFVVAPGSGTAIEINQYDCWYESNWASLSAGTDKHNEFHARFDGQQGTVRHRIQDTKFISDASSPRAVSQTSVARYVIDNPHSANVDTQFWINGGSSGEFTNWNAGGNGAFDSRVSVASNSSAYNAKEFIDNYEEELLSGWTAYTPTYGGTGSLTFGTVTTNKAAYKQKGKTLFVSINAIGTTGGSGSAAITISLPAGYRSKDANSYQPCLTSQNGGSSYSLGAIRADGVNPSSGLEVYLDNFANWGLGAGRQVIANAFFELF